MIELSNPAIAASYAIGTTYGTDFFTDGAAFTSGHLGILGIDAGSINFKVYGSFSFSEHSATFEVDGHYVAPLCP